MSFNQLKHRLAQVIAALAHTAKAAIGNDTGPMHLIALCGCPSVSLFSSASDPQQSAPRGEHVRVLQKDDLHDLSVDAVEETLRSALRPL